METRGYDSWLVLQFQKEEESISNTSLTPFLFKTSEIWWLRQIRIWHFQEENGSYTSVKKQNPLILKP